MSGSITITTHHLPTAGVLRHAFEEAGDGVELVTPGETLDDVRTEPSAVVLTGLEEGGERSPFVGLPGVPVLALLPRDDLPPRDRCRQLGLTECIARPADPQDVVLITHRHIAREELRRATGIVGKTEAMDEVLERVVQIAEVGATVLIQGESGTGKELIARGIHMLSPRRHRPFIAANVAALPETLLESELFGHEKGAFTGASSLRKGLFELADGGTIFLDEIGEMPLTVQSKLLRVLESREFRRVGGEVTIRVNVRVVTATNRSLRHAVQREEFRRDLYHRLNVLRIDLPPLRDRRKDIPILVDHFVREITKEYGRSFPGISPEAMRALVEYEWPGNIRELRNLVESMVVLAPSRPILPADLPAEIAESGQRSRTLPVPVRAPERAERPEKEGGGANRAELEFIFRTLVELKMDVEGLRSEIDTLRDDHLPLVLDAGEAAFAAAGAEEERPESGGAPATGRVVYRPGMTMEDLEREAIAAALEEVGGNRRRAAEILDIGERTLYRKIKEYGIGGEG